MLATTGSITTASRLVKLIEKETGLSARVIGTPREINKGGCSYSVRFNENIESEVRRIIRQYKINSKKIYRESVEGSRRVYHALP